MSKEYIPCNLREVEFWISINILKNLTRLVFSRLNTTELNLVPKQKFLPFYISGYCARNNRNCLNFQFKIFEQIHKNTDYVIRVFITGKVCHNDIVRRQISGEGRSNLADMGQKTAACILAGKLVQSGSREAMGSGNMNHVPSSMLLNKINSDDRKKNDLDPNFFKHLQLLHKKLKENAKWKGKHLEGFIFGQTNLPNFSVTMTSERQIILLLSMLEENKYAVLHFDATRSLFAQLSDVKKRVFYYCVTLSEKDVSFALPVLEFISSGHSVYAIHTCLSLFVDLVKQITSIRPIVPRIETDFSKTMLQSACKAFNNCDLMTYINFAFDKLQKPETKFTFTVLHICSSHFIKSGIIRIKNIYG